ncbi:MAG: phage/plasmid replication protein, II/X family [Candidatus Sedimenticola sp. (ex Thyasira tokunagai)]
MIDKLVLRCRFKDESLPLDIPSLGIPYEGSFDEVNELSYLRHPWESIPSSFHGVAFKVQDYSQGYLGDKEMGAWVLLKASPAKVSQGHNLFGSDDLEECALQIMKPFFHHYPWLVDHLDLESWTVDEVDITYHSRAENEIQATQFIQSLKNISKGHTAARGGYISTVYFGQKKSRIKKIKIYAKYLELMQQIKSMENKKGLEHILALYTDELTEWARGLVRWEATLKTRWFERRGQRTNLKEMIANWDAKKYWEMATKELFEALEGQTMKICNDNELHEKLRLKYEAVTKTGRKTYIKADNAYKTYQLIKQLGFPEAKRICQKASFWNHVNMIESLGISLAYLQNLQTNSAHCCFAPKTDPLTPPYLHRILTHV